MNALFKVVSRYVLDRKNVLRYKGYIMNLQYTQMNMIAIMPSMMMVMMSMRMSFGEGGSCVYR